MRIVGDFMNLANKIYKLLRALNNSGYIYLYRRDQTWSYQLKKPCNIHKIYRQWTVEEYIHDVDADYKPKKNQKIVKKELCNSFKQVDIVLWLRDRWNEVKDDERKT